MFFFSLAKVAAYHFASNQGLVGLQVGEISEPSIELIIDPRVDPVTFVLTLKRADLGQKFTEIVTGAAHYFV